MPSAEYMIRKGQQTRRTFLETGARVGGALLGAWGLSHLQNLFSDPLRDFPITRPDRLGTTFSQVQCKHLGMNDQQTRQAYIKVLEMFDVVRIGGYMDEITRDGFGMLDWMLDQATDKQTPVILTVGLKAPRVPEFYPSAQIEERLNLTKTRGQTIGEDEQTFKEVLEHVKTVVNHVDEREIVEGYQGGNEDGARFEFAKNHAISDQLQDAKVQTLKDLTKKDIYRSDPFNIPGADQSFLRNLEREPDAAGFNIYYRVPNPRGGYYQLTYNDFKKLEIGAQLMKSKNIRPVIFESQAEPWEDGSHVHIDKLFYESSNPDLAIKLSSKLASIGYGTILLWGCEYWYLMANHPNPDLRTDEWLVKMENYARRRFAA